MKCIYLLLLIGFTTSAYGQANKATINDLKFMAGTWVMQHEWGDMEEYWGEPMGNNMVCSFRCVKDGQVLFYEFIVIEQSDSVPVMMLRHFNPGSIAWEDKEHPHYFPLVSLQGAKAVFYNKQTETTISYELTGPDTLTTILEKKEKDGKMESTPFRYTRKKG